MKKILLLFAMILAFGIIIISCKEEEKECETNNIGTVTVLNSSDKEHLIAVSRVSETPINGVLILSNLNFTWENIPAGELVVWAYGAANVWVSVDTIALSACENFSYSFVENCETNNAGTVTISNTTSENIKFDVRFQKVGTSWMSNEEVTVVSGGSYTWEELEVGDVAIEYYNSDNKWVVDSIIALNACDDHHITFNEACAFFSVGTVTITNNSGEYLNFAVTNDKDSNGNWIPNEGVGINNGQSYTWENLDAGEVAIGFYDHINEWVIDSVIVLDVCGSYLHIFDKLCEIYNVGTVTVTNNSGEWWEFDVTHEKNSEGDWITNEQVRIYNGESYTWESIPSGEIAIWTADSSNPWEISELKNLSTCEEFNYVATEECQLFNFTDVKVTNSTDDHLWVDVFAGEWLGERYVTPNSSTTYSNVEVGEVYFGARYENQSSWAYSNYYIVHECEEFEFTWTASKKASLPTGTKENVERAPKVIKVGGKIDFSDAPAK
jgi:hypothetical protein